MEGKPTVGGHAFSNRRPFSTAAVSSSPDNADTVCAGEARAAGAAADEGVIPRALRRCFERVEELPDRAGLKALTSLAVIAVVLFIVVQVIGHIVAAVVTHPEDEDERDRRISLRGEQVAGIVLGLGVISTIGHILASGWFEHEMLVLLGSPFGILNLLVGSLALAEVARCLTQIILYRRDA